MTIEAILVENLLFYCLFIRQNTHKLLRLHETGECASLSLISAFTMNMNANTVWNYGKPSQLASIICP